MHPAPPPRRTWLAGLLAPLQQRWNRWLQRRHPHGIVAQRLTQNRVYIFLSRSGLVFCIMLVAMLGGAINYDLALAYLLVFLLASMALASVFHTFRNLLGLSLMPGRADPCFAGEVARFEVILENDSRLPRHNLGLRFEGLVEASDVAPGDTARVWLPLSASKRGWLVAPRLRIETHWPLGVFQAWSYAFFSQRALVYPKPENDPPPLPMAATGDGEGTLTPRGQDDFAGLRPFQRGDSPRHVAWKVAARDDALMVKEFHGQAAEALWLDWDAASGLIDAEARLSRLTAWVLAAHAAGLAYGLRLPGEVLAADQGEAHRDACLAALALHGIREAT
ncbi:DUF58 domain-containing protein [Chitinimonas viridis]|uniref:DUF58 domain-containing protein n=1 Tax=Chitinimonas viridis TaxID=664880 RepID=A0ABT8B7Q6_9NEIS|nr:DUF58 domain-containing protein [Chitinimonas viridis]MDN3577636.1 DUF58 domain-containing protein [Chitinimonas viridis]